jgi:hypothetical protein
LGTRIFIETRLPQNLSSFVQKTKVTSTESEDLPSQNASRKLAVFSLNLGILIIEDEKKSSLAPDLRTEAFSLPPAPGRKRNFGTGVRAHCTETGAARGVVELVNIR